MNRQLVYRNSGVGVLGLVALVVILALRESYYIDIFATIGIFFIMLMGLDLFIGYTGQLSIGHNGFFAIGAYASALVTVKLGGSPWLAMPIGMMSSVIVGLILAAPFIKLKGFYLALVTLAFGLIIHGMTLALPDITSGAAGIGGVPKLQLLGIPLNTDFKYCLFVWALVIPIFWLCLNIINSRIGRVFRAIRDDELPGQTIGINTTRYKTMVFLLSAVLASLSGSLYTHFNGSVTPDAVSVFIMFELILMLFIGGRETIWGGLLGVALIRGLPEVFVGLREYKTLAYGVVFILVIVFMPMGIAGWLTQLAKKLEAKLLGSSALSTQPAVSTIIPFKQDNTCIGAAPPEPLLEVVNVTKLFGGLVAVSDLSFQVHRGEVKTIVGPNGAGKTTVFNIINGILTADRGSINFSDNEITARKPMQIASLGIGRTFQTPRVFGHMTALENVMLGRHKMARAGILAGAFSLPAARSEENLIVKVSLDTLAFVSLAHKANSPAGSLPLGEKRLLEVARALAGQPELLLLDEPASGLNDTEKKAFSEMIFRLKELGISILLVEHDMNFVMRVSDNIIVMNYGQKIAEGIPSEIQTNQKVIDVYLGRRSIMSGGTKRMSELHARNRQQEPVLITDDLWTGYGGITVVKGVSVSVGTGEVVCIIGANGAGKSSLLECTAGILPIQRGKIILSGEDITHIPPHLRARQGLFLVRERSQILATLSVADNLRLVAFASLRRMGKTSFKRAIERVFDIFPKLKGKENRTAGTLSGGEQRMVALAQGFVANPKIMLLDEPFLGLAPIVIDDILQVIQNFRKEKVSILLVEQNASLALEMADRGYVMETGKIILEGPRDLISGNENIRAAYLGRGSDELY